MPKLIEIVPPTACPECGGELEEIDEGGVGIAQHFCTMPFCPGKLREHLAFVGSRDVLEIDGLGPEMARKLVDGGYARNLWELYEFQADLMNVRSVAGDAKLLEHTKKKGFDVTIIKVLDSLEKAKTAPWERWIKALGIPMIGETLGKVIAAKAKLGAKSMATLDADLILFAAQEVEQFGEAKMRAIRDWAGTNGVLCQKLYSLGVRPAPVEVPQVVEGAPLAGTVFCITGEVDEDRKSLYAKLEKLGAVGKTGVSAKVNLLIVLPSAGKSKITKASQLGIKQVDKAWLEKTLADSGMPLKPDTFAAEESDE